MVAGIAASRGIKVKLPSLQAANTKAGFYISISSVVSALPSVTVTTYKNNNSTPRETIINAGNLVTLLGGGNGYVCGTTTLDYDEIGITFNSGLASVGLSADIFYGFGGASTCPVSVLPVRNIVFSVSNEEKPLLTWKAEDDGDVLYEVQRSNNEQLFKTIYQVTGASYSGLKEFLYTDIDAPAGTIYYRIFARDKSGTGFYSRSVSVKPITTTNNNIVTFPNPVKGNVFTIRLSKPATNQHLQIIDKGGRVLYSEYVVAPRNNLLNIHLDKYLPAGIYIIKLNSNSKEVQAQYGKFIILE